MSPARAAMAAARPAVKRVGTFVDRVLPPPAGVTVLIYHRVGGGSDSAVDLDPEVFDAQLAHLVAHHRILTLDQALDELGVAATGWGAAHRATGATGDTTTGVSDGVTSGAVDGGPVDPRRAVAITFDDGTDDFVDVAVPILERHGVPATIYVATHFVDAGEPFPWGARPATWSGLADAAVTGLVTVGSHTHRHLLLDRLAPDELAADLDRSIELVATHLGAAPQHFAYPKAVPGSPAAEIAVRRRFRSAALAASRVNRPGRTDPFRLWRTPVQRTDGPAQFAAKADGGLRLEGELRSLAARVRYRGEVT